MILFGRWHSALPLLTSAVESNQMRHIYPEIYFLFSSSTLKTCQVCNETRNNHLCGIVFHESAVDSSLKRERTIHIGVPVLHLKLNLETSGLYSNSVLPEFKVTAVHKSLTSWRTGCPWTPDKIFRVHSFLLDSAERTGSQRTSVTAVSWGSVKSCAVYQPDGSLKPRTVFSIPWSTSSDLGLTCIIIQVVRTLLITYVGLICSGIHQVWSRREMILMHGCHIGFNI